jgi:hypothetical protein
MLFSYALDEPKILDRTIAHHVGHSLFHPTHGSYDQSSLQPAALRSVDFL